MHIPELPAFPNARFNLHRLYELVSVYGPSGREMAVAELAGELLSKACKEIEIDGEGNLYAVRRGDATADTILLCCHMDTVRFPPQERHIVIQDGFLQLDHSPGGATAAPVLGGDDRAGIEVALSVLDAYQGPLNLKVLLTVREEIGGEGMHDAQRSWLEGTRFGLVLDRKHSGDIITIIERTRLCNRDLVRKVLKAGNSARVRDLNVTDGAFSDAYFLARRFKVPCVNMSVGYYHPHSPMERIDLHALDDCVRWVNGILYSSENE